MSSRADDQSKVAALAHAHPRRVVPAFGYHPWWTHAISLRRPPPAREEHYRALFLGGGEDLKDSGEKGKEREEAFQRLWPGLAEPRALDDVLEELRANLVAFPAALLGEVGIDRAARPDHADPFADWSRRALSPFTTPLDHQLAVLDAQLALAVELRRPVSLHSVKAPAPTRALLDRAAARHGHAFSAVSVDLHSCGLSPEVWVDIEKHHANVYLSLSTAINARSPNHVALIRTAAPTRLLAESDYPFAHLSAQETWRMVLTIAQTRGWRVEDAWDYPEVADESEIVGEDAREGWGVVRRLEENWRAFLRGGHAPPGAEKKVGKSSARRRRDYSYDVWDSGEESGGETLDAK
ncbi:Metallo-dependent hydrolase [Auriscalpium vulgare]|uniref:Metallo-dependent hydrolase n=1 Tax=Auriscalpium vulgare TaxID=40419 RepID=A0ACB8RS98_9AGAM|nr:Metallo-dependent hydrolase [Auriscalpium vulgare]